MEEYFIINGKKLPTDQIEKLNKRVNHILYKYPLPDISSGGEDVLQQFYGNLRRAEGEINRLFKKLSLI